MYVMFIEDRNMGHRFLLERGFMFVYMYVCIYIYISYVCIYIYILMCIIDLRKKGENFFVIFWRMILFRVRMDWNEGRKDVVCLGIFFEFVSCYSANGKVR